MRQASSTTLIVFYFLSASRSNLERILFYDPIFLQMNFNWRTMLPRAHVRVKEIIIMTVCVPMWH